MVVTRRADGESVAEIAAHFKLNPRTVQNYLCRAAKKKGCKTIADLMVYVWRNRMQKDVHSAQPTPVHP
jgi:DNA-binding NarL/FixJ family response regulator